MQTHHGKKICKFQGHSNAKNKGSWSVNSINNKENETQVPITNHVVITYSIYNSTKNWIVSIESQTKSKLINITKKLKTIFFKLRLSLRITKTITYRNL